ncbi:MAG: hypothetical protein ACYSW7_05905 [Planctomycetota bacterium]|jgi:hypothetical protein
MKNRKFKNAFTVYFETNVLRDLVENRGGATDKKLPVLRKKISQGRIVIVPSFEVFEELVSVLQLDPTLSKKFCRLYDNLVNWDYCLKPMDQILADDITSFATTGAAACPFNPVDESSSFIQSIRANRYVLRKKLLKDLIDKGTAQKRSFAKNVLSVSEQFKPKRNKKASSRKDYESQFLSFWEPGGYAEKVAEMLVRNSKESSKIRARGLTEFIKLPTIRLAVGYILHSKYKQVADGAVCKNSDFYDFRHAVIAGAVGNIVTQDKKLRNAINHVPEHNIIVWTLDELKVNGS